MDMKVMTRMAYAPLWRVSLACEATSNLVLSVWCGCVCKQVRVAIESEMEDRLGMILVMQQTAHSRSTELPKGRLSVGMSSAMPVMTKSMRAAAAKKQLNKGKKDTQPSQSKSKGKSKKSAKKSGKSNPKLGKEKAGEAGQPDQSKVEQPFVNEQSEGHMIDANEYFVGVEEIKEVQATDDFIKKCRAFVELKEQLRIMDVDDAQYPIVQRTMRKELLKIKTKTERGEAQSMILHEDNDLVCYAMSNRHWPVPVINDALGQKVILQAHEQISNVHVGERKMVHWIRQRYWWRCMYTQIQEHTKHCIVCQKMKFASQPGYGFMQLRTFDRPGRCICIDIVVLRHKSAAGTEYLFTILDSFSHYPDAYCMSDSSAETCASCLMKWIQYNGMPEEIRSDGGLNLNRSELFTALYKLLGIKSKVTHPYAPQGNTVESWHRWLGSALRILYYERDMDVDQSLPFILWIYRGTENRMTGFTPFALHMGREVRFPLDVFDGTAADLTPHEYATHVREQMTELWKTARLAQEISQEQTAKYYNSKHGVLKDIVQGSMVLRQKINQTPGDVSTHMLPRCNGPYKVLKVTSLGARIRHSVTGNELRCSLRQLRPLHFKSADLAKFSEDGETKFSAGQILIVRLMVPKQEKRKWLPVKLLHSTMDQDAWEVQWYNTHDQGDMLTARYHLAWEKSNGEEIYCANAKTGYRPLQWCVYKGRFITPAFKFQSNRLPPAIRALIRSHSVSKPVSKK